MNEWLSIEHDENSLEIWKDNKYKGESNSIFSRQWQQGDGCSLESWDREQESMQLAHHIPSCLVFIWKKWQPGDREHGRKAIMWYRGSFSVSVVTIRSRKGEPGAQEVRFLFLCKMRKAIAWGTSYGVSKKGFLVGFSTIMSEYKVCLVQVTTQDKFGMLGDLF